MLLLRHHFETCITIKLPLASDALSSLAYSLVHSAWLLAPKEPHFMGPERL